QDLLQGSQGLNLALHFLSGAISFDPVVTLVDPKLASQVLWLDAFITNVDRTCKNTNMLIWYKDLWLIDHGAAFYFHHSWSNFDQQAKSPFKFVKDHVLLPQASLLEEVDEEFKNILSEEKLREIVDLIPDEWLEWKETNESPEEIKEVYLQFLLTRLAHSQIFIKEAQDARKALI
ncbi:MAG TPA: HipA family kinase, partial [Salinimicrobium sp.]|nr:HipA family kinase [Salinimicrobium sp.]